MLILQYVPAVSLPARLRAAHKDTMRLIRILQGRSQPGGREPDSQPPGTRFPGLGNRIPKPLGTGFPPVGTKDGTPSPVHIRKYKGGQVRA